MDRFERFNVGVARVIEQALPVVMLVVAFALTNIQLPLVMAAFVVGTGALAVFSIRRRVSDFTLASAAYVFVSSAVHLARR